MITARHLKIGTSMHIIMFKCVNVEAIKIDSVTVHVNQIDGKNDFQHVSILMEISKTSITMTL